ncbi:hypothetical protein [Actibacterium sp. XHP0104]|uniref:hypothetical protein n=1 Tax=Actibacterium sp. XHP0104 TaxID=2984335 RepID=UPI0021E7513E|nr:hypothetical protein [Actibacterium sp. XHP0104]MCV2881793.1 hypothetical protein [Actibacterium sp. XHP0104]
MTNPVQDFLTLLEQEHRLLLRGDCDGLAHLEGRKLRALEALGSCGNDLSTLQLTDIKARAARNARLLNSVQQGIRAGLSRLDDIRSGLTAPLQTYGPDGGQHRFAAGRNRLEKRA